MILLISAWRGGGENLPIFEFQMLAAMLPSSFHPKQFCWKFFSVLNRTNECLKSSLWYLALKFRMMPWSKGWSFKVVFGGRNSTVMFFFVGRFLWEPQLSMKWIIFLFFNSINLSTYFNHSLKISLVIQDFLFDF